MQRKDVERLAWQAEMLAAPLTKGGEFEALRVHHENTAAALRALLAERDAAFAAGQEEMLKRVFDLLRKVKGIE